VETATISGWAIFMLSVQYRQSMGVDIGVFRALHTRFRRGSRTACRGDRFYPVNVYESLSSRTQSHFNPQTPWLGLRRRL